MVIMKVDRIQHKIDLEETIPSFDLRCDECDNYARYEVLYEEKDSMKSRMIYVCGDCESDMEEAS